jgi:hypothetical protein
MSKRKVIQGPDTEPVNMKVPSVLKKLVQEKIEKDKAQLHALYDAHSLTGLTVHLWREWLKGTKP